MASAANKVQIAEDGRRLSVGLEGGLAPGAVLDDCRVLHQEVLEEVLLVELGDEARGQAVDHVIHQQIHDRLWHRVEDVLAHNLQVRLQEGHDEAGLHFLLLRETLCLVLVI